MKLEETLKILTIVAILGCTQDKRPVYGEEYGTIVSYIDDDPDMERVESYEEKLDKNTLYLFFEAKFSADTIEVTVNDSEKIVKVLTTEESSGLASTIELDNLPSIRKVEISKNRGVPMTLQIRDKSMNKWGIKFYSDTLRAMRYENARLYY